MSAQDNALAPCPFCGSANIGMGDAADFVACLDCHAEGPVNMGMGSGYNAEAWNKRAAAPQQAAPAQPVAWLCELAMEDGSNRTQFVTENPDGLRWNDAGEPSPYRTTPLYAAAQPMRQPLDEIASDLLAALVELEAMAESYRPPGYPIPDAQKKTRAAIARAHGIGDAA